MSFVQSVRKVLGVGGLAIFGVAIPAPFIDMVKHTMPSFSSWNAGEWAVFFAMGIFGYFALGSSYRMARGDEESRAQSMGSLVGYAGMIVFMVIFTPHAETYVPTAYEIHVGQMVFFLLPFVPLLDLVLTTLVSRTQARGASCECS